MQMSFVVTSLVCRFAFICNDVLPRSVDDCHVMFCFSCSVNLAWPYSSVFIAINSINK